MKSNLLIVLFLFLLSIGACFLAIPLSNSTADVGGKEVPCIGAFEDKNPNYTYGVDAGNVILAILSSPALFIPSAYIIFDRIQCPTGLKVSETKKEL